LPYERRSQAHPRQCIFGATTNRDTWHRDETGARRWWPVRCGVTGAIEIDLLHRDRDQLWAEARDRYIAGERWWLDTPELIEQAREEQEARFDQDPWETLIIDHLQERNETGMDSLLEAVRVPAERRSTAEAKCITAILKRRNWVRKQIGTGHSRSWKYIRKI
jgi:predicted P-loop ATPase